MDPKIACSNPFLGTFEFEKTTMFSFSGLNASALTFLSVLELEIIFFCGASALKAFNIVSASSASSLKIFKGVYRSLRYRYFLK